MTENIRMLMEEPSAERIQRYYDGMRPFWHPVVRSEDLLEGKPSAAELLGEPLVLARLNGRLVAMQDLCRHFQARLSQGEITRVDGNDCLQCPYHGWTYGEDGRVVYIPQLGAGRDIPADAKVPVYLTTEKHGLVWVCLHTHPHFDLPDFPELEDGSFHSGSLRVYEPWRASVPRVVMGALDDTHFPWVHTGLLGDRSAPEAPDHKAWREGDALKVAYTMNQPRNPSTGTHTGQGGFDRIEYLNSVTIPGVIRLVKTSENGQVYVIWLAACPNRFNQTKTFWRVVRNYDHDPAHDSDYEAFEDRVRAQDKVIVEGQRPWLLPPFWEKIELPLRPADIPLIEYQRWLQELGVVTDI